MWLGPAPVMKSLITKTRLAELTEFLLLYQIYILNIYLFIYYLYLLISNLYTYILIYLFMCVV